MKRLKDELARFIRSTVRETMEEYIGEAERRIGEAAEEWRRYADTAREEDRRVFERHLDEYAARQEERTAGLESSIKQYTEECVQRAADELLPKLDKQIERWTWERYQRVQNKLAPQIERNVEQAVQAQLMDELFPKLDKQIERWTWERYLRVQNKLEPQIEQAVQAQLMNELFPKLDKQIERWTWERYKRTEARAEELHRHLELTYRDLMVVLEKQLTFVGEHDIELKTDYPCAYESLDAIYPRGTANDNTRYPRFIKRCETVLQRDSGLSFLDLGCSGGGMVLDAVLRGHLGIGLEGSDYSLIRQRAEWRLLRNNLFTCDITKPFSLIHKASGGVVQFDVITAWEVLEHIAEDDLPRMFANIRAHLADGGLFVGSIACWDDIDPDTGVNWHVTVHPPEWWQERFVDWGFEEVPDLFSVEDMARGSINRPISWQALKPLKIPSYLVVLRKRTEE